MILNQDFDKAIIDQKIYIVIIKTEYIHIVTLCNESNYIVSDSEFYGFKLAEMRYKD